MTRRLCPGTGQPPAVVWPALGPYPRCSVCGREMAAQGRKAHRRYANAWSITPRHFVTVPAHA